MSKTMLCYVVKLLGKTFYVQVGHMDEFLALYPGEFVEISDSTKWFKFSHALHWYERISN